MRRDYSYGFFRVELLVIVFTIVLVLLVAVPKAKGVLLNIKLNSAVDSVMSYKESINNFYMGKLFNDESFKLDGVYTISNGNLVGNGNNYNINIHGNVPSGGYLFYEDNNLKSGCVIIDGYSFIITDGNIDYSSIGNCIVEDKYGVL